MLHRLMNDKKITDTIEVFYARSTDTVHIITQVEKKHIVVVKGGRDIPWYSIPPQYHSLIFSEKEMMYCPLDHERVPHHRLATPDEIQNLPTGKLPIIRTYDIVSRWLGFIENDIIAIERKDGVYYRKVSR